MIYATVKDDFVENLIVASPLQLEELSEALDAELIPVMPYNLQIGDYRRPDGVWTRNVGGEQVELEEQETPPTLEELAATMRSLTEVITTMQSDIDELRRIIV